MYVDYEPLGTTVTLEPLSNRTCFTGEIINDVIALEGVEDFVLLLGDPMEDGILLAIDRAVVIIVDDDGESWCGSCYHNKLCTSIAEGAHKITWSMG